MNVADIDDLQWVFTTIASGGRSVWLGLDYGFSHIPCIIRSDLVYGTVIDAEVEAEIVLRLDHRISALDARADGTVWLALQNRELITNAPRPSSAWEGYKSEGADPRWSWWRLKLSQLEDDLPTALAALDDGSVLCGTLNGRIVKIRADGTTFSLHRISVPNHSLEGPQAPAFVNALHKGLNGTVYALSRAGALVTITGHVCTSSTVELASGPTNMLATVELKGGALLVACERGIILEHDPRLGTWNLYQEVADDIQGLVTFQNEIYIVGTGGCWSLERGRVRRLRPTPALGICAATEQALVAVNAAQPDPESPSFLAWLRCDGLDRWEKIEF